MKENSQKYELLYRSIEPFCHWSRFGQFVLLCILAGSLKNKRCRKWPGKHSYSFSFRSAIFFL